MDNQDSNLTRTVADLPHSVPVANTRVHKLPDEDVRDSSKEERRDEENWESEGGAMAPAAHREPEAKGRR